MPKQSDLKHKPRIFLCHAGEDKPRVQELYHQLKEAGYDPWLDKEDLLPGQDWWTEIEKIIRNVDNLVVVCLSHNAVTKKGIFQKEIKRALDVLDEMPDDTIYLIPARLEDCLVPDRLSKLHWVDLFASNGFKSLRRALDFEIRKRPPESEPKATNYPQILSPRKSFEPELVLIPAGDFLMGSDSNIDRHAHDDEQPQHRLSLSDFYMAKTLVTNTEYAAFVQATNYHHPDHWKSEQPPTDKQDHPVVNVSWHDALAYCQWLTKTTSRIYELPKEAEWEKAARGRDGRIYPWGNYWDAERCNTNESARGGTTPVGTYPDGASPYGLLDMAGNVWEWCATKWRKSYPYNVEEDEQSVGYLEDGGDRVLRGGSWSFNLNLARCAIRYYESPNRGGDTIGFRLLSPI